MPKKIRELRSALSKAGFELVRTRGSHQRWVHTLLPEFPITIASQDGDDAKAYLEKLVENTLKALAKRNR
jgi:predicted RNA binding protein YcfA (HicA-like mRNA interferase family)